MQGRLAAGTHPVANAHRHADHRLRHQAGEHCGQCPFHACASDQHTRLLQAFELAQQPVQACHSHIEQLLTANPMPVQGQLRFASNR